MELFTERLKLKDVMPEVATDIAKEYDLKEEDLELVRKNNPLKPEDIKIEDGERAAIRYVNTADVDRDNEIVVPDGLQTKDFLKSPSVLYAHNYRGLPIGRDIWLKLIKGKGWLAKTIYAKHELATDVYNLVKDKFLNTNSIGFIPLESVKPDNKKWDKVKAKLISEYGIKEKLIDKVSRIYTNSILLEHSDVPIPSNISALNIAVGKGFIKSDQLIKDLEVEIIDEEKEEVELSEEGNEYKFESYKDDSGTTRYRAEIECPKCKEKRWVDRRNIEKENFTGLCLKCLNNSTGKDSNAYKDGKWNQSNGYIGILASLVEPEFQCMKDSRGYIYEHRYIMAKKLKRPLEKFEQVHHLNGIKDDNRLENLELIGEGEHLLITKMQTRIKELESEAIKSEDVEKPYPGEHACRIRSPGGFQPGSFRRMTRRSDGREYAIIMGRLKGETTLTEQAYRYGIKVWTVSVARKHCKDHKGIAFEPATGKGEEDILKKGVIPFKETPKAPEGEAWDAGAEVKKASGNATRLKTMHTWVDSGGADNFDADERQWYKLPHHKGTGTQAVVWKGVAAGMAVLFGARGGVTLSDDNRKGVYNHLVKHYKQFDKEPPGFRDYDEAELKGLFPDEQEEKLKEIGFFDIKELAEIVNRNKELVKENKELQAAYEIITSKLKEKIKDLELKAGAVLNRKNKNDLIEAQKRIQNVLDSATTAEEEGEGEDNLEIKDDVLEVEGEETEEKDNDTEEKEETIDISEDEIKGIISEVLNGKVDKLADTLKKEVGDNFKKMTGKVM